jgi:hypothetical protein
MLTVPTDIQTTTATLNDSRQQQHCVVGARFSGGLFLLTGRDTDKCNPYNDLSLSCHLCQYL